MTAVIPVCVKMMKGYVHIKPPVGPDGSPPPLLQTGCRYNQKEASSGMSAGRLKAAAAVFQTA